MNKNNLNRIKGILSAKQGTLVPKFLEGFVIYHKSTNQPLYSKDGTLWFTDENYMSPFTGNMNEYTEPELGLLFYTKNSNVTIPGLNNTTSSNTLNSNIVSNALNNIQSTQNSNKSYNFIQNPINGIQGITNFANYYGPAIPGGIDTDVNASVKSAANINKQIAQETQDFRNQTIARENVIKLPITSTADVLNSMNEPFTPSTRNASPVETNFKLSKEDRLLSRQMRREERNANISSEQELKYSNIAQGVSEGIQTLGNAFGAQQSATDSQLTKNIDTVYNGITSAVSNMGPAGQVAGMVMNTLGAIGNISQAIGGGTDLQTKLDSWMDSPLLSWNIGAINGFFGKNTDSFNVDLKTLLQVGSSYGGITTSINEAAESADKEYGLFSGKARKKANDAINKAKQLQNSMKNIADLASDQQLLVSSTGEQAGLAYSMMTDGGYNQKYTYAAKQGGVLELEPDIKLEWEPLVELNWELPKFKEGGNIDIVEELEWIPELQKGNKIRTIEELIEYAKKQNPRFIQRMSEPLRFIRINFKDENGNTSWAHATHEMNYKGKDVFSMIQEIDGKLYKFDSEEEAYENAKKTNNILTFDSEEEAKLFAKSGQNENGEYYGYKLGWQDFFNTSPEGLKEEYSINLYKQGGSVKESDVPEIEETNLKNVIPEGALHKNKHHMEHAEGLTKKGIPVIDEEGEQQAEIEHSEIIFTLEVTKKLEEYYQIFYSEESTNKEKEQAALDAGKLLVYQILENTEDRTGLIDSCKRGGTLTLKKSTDDLIEEVLEWIPNITIIEEVVEEKPKKESKKSEKELMKEAIKEVLIEILTK